MADRLIQRLDGFTRLVSTLEACDPQSLPADALPIFNLAQAARFSVAAILSAIQLGPERTSTHPSSRHGFQLHRLTFRTEQGSVSLGEIHHPTPVETSGVLTNLVLSSGFNVSKGCLSMNNHIYAQGDVFSILGFTDRSYVHGLFQSRKTGPVLGRAAFSRDMGNLHTVFGFKLTDGQIGQQVIEDFMLPLS